MTKNFDDLLKACLNEMQTTPAPGNKEAELLKTVAGLLTKPDFSKAMEELVKKHNPPQPPAQPTQQTNNQQPNQQPNQQQKPQGQTNPQQNPQQQNNNAGK